MSLKNFTKELFTRYGLTEEEINVYLVCLRVPRTTVSEVYLTLEEKQDITFERVLEITNTLVENGFLKEVGGIVPRYIPLEPFFELFTNESELFRNEIGKIKDNILTDQSERFAKLEQIQDNSVAEVEKAVESQINDFFADSDAKNKAKKERIDAGTERFTNTSKTLERELHEIKDKLNVDLASISTSFVKEYEDGILDAKSDLKGLVSELLKDFANRVDEIETVLKKDLDNHVDRHEKIASELKPQLEQILEKYLERIDKIVVELKDKYSRLLNVHVNHVKTTTDNLQTSIKATVDDRHFLLTDQIRDFKNKTITLIDNLLESSNRFSDFSKEIAKKGFFWVGKKPKYKARFEEIKANVLSISEPLREDFTNENEQYIKDTRETSDNIKNEVVETLSTENNTLASESKKLDKEGQETLDAQLEALAKDMAGEVDNTLQRGIKDCSDTTIKLKDLLEDSLRVHHRDYDRAINEHIDKSLKHYDDCNLDVKNKNDSWVSEVNANFSEGKKNISIKIDAENDFWNKESADMNKNLENMLEDHKSKYEQNAKTLQNSLSNTTRDTAQNQKDIIADFTLEFMNSIDDATELAETNEEKLTNIFNASNSIPAISKVSTWLVIGLEALVNCIKDVIYRVKSSVIVVMPVVVPEILSVVSEHAFQRKSARFMLTSRWDLSVYKDVIQRMKKLGNIQFRQLNQPGEYFAITRDAEEVILAPYSEKSSEIISVVSNQAGYARLYSQFIGPIFQANSRPI